MGEWRVCRDRMGNAYPCYSEPLYCPFCGDSELIIHYFFVPVGDGFNHVDVQLKCPVCEHVVSFGVSTYSAMDREALRSSSLHGRVLRHELVRNGIIGTGSREYGIVVDRLKRLGYW